MKFSGNFAPTAKSRLATTACPIMRATIVRALGAGTLVGKVMLGGVRAASHTGARTQGPAGLTLFRSPNVCGDFMHLLAEDPAWVGVMQQSPKIGFERFAAFSEQVRRGA